MIFDKNVGSALADHDHKPVRQGGPYMEEVERRSVLCHFMSVFSHSKIHKSWINLELSFLEEKKWNFCLMNAW